MADILEVPKLKTFDPRQYQVPEQPAPPGYIKTLEEQAKRHEEEYGQALADWKKAYDDTVAEKADLYKANPKYAEAKRKEAAIKTLVGAFGSLADTAAVAFGGTAPLRDHRADIYRTQQQADALDQNERAKEANAYQKYLDRLEKLADKRPKWAKNDAAIQLARIYADDNRWTLNAALQRELQKRREEEAEKDRKATAALTQVRINADTKKGNEPKPYSTVYIDLNDGQGKRSIPLDNGKFANLADIILKHKGYSIGSEEANNDPDMRLLAYSMGNGDVSKSSWEQLLAKYPDLIRDAVREMVYGATAAPVVPAEENPSDNKKPYSTVFTF